MSSSGLLRHIGDAQALLELQRAVVGLLQPAQDLEERRLAGAIAADQADALRFDEREVRMVEQRDVAERELRVEECDECHVARIIGGRFAARLSNLAYTRGLGSERAGRFCSQP